MPTVSSYFQVSLNSASREIASVVKESYNSAVITGKVHRLVYDLAAGQFWVESGPPTVLLDTRESKEREERRKRFASPNEAPPPAVFQLERTVTRKKLSLPRGVAFEDIVTQQNPEPVQEGLAYTHFFPHGFTEQTLIHLKDTANHKVTLVVSPLVGRTDYYERYATTAEIFGQ